ncbi:hypothetical protein Droror1_Dr00024530, partial [Drosera rotundifolia]
SAPPLPHSAAGPNSLFSLHAQLPISPPSFATLATPSSLLLFSSLEAVFQQRWFGRGVAEVLIVELAEALWLKCLLAVAVGFWWLHLVAAAIGQGIW